MLTIKQLADYVGVTPRAIRHYHRIGLLREPERTASGYRDYQAQDVIDLQRIKVLADAGVPLARVQDLTHAGTGALAEAVGEIDAALATRIKELRETRRRLVALASGGDPFLPPRVAALFQQARELGVSERTIDLGREGWILIQALYPEQVEAWFAWQERWMEDPEYRRLYLATDQAHEWALDDPRLEELAQRTVAWLLRQPTPDSSDWDDDHTAYQLVVGYEAEGDSAWAWLNRRVIELMEDALSDPA